MANPSIYAAFERLWQHIVAALGGKSNVGHNHDDLYDTTGSADAALNAAKEYTNTKTENIITASDVDTKVLTHNTSDAAHNDIRVLINDLKVQLNNFLDVDDATTDQLSEIITLINNNKGTLESLTTSKINVSDIVNDLTTNSTSKVLSAAQGVAIQTLIDALEAELGSHTNNKSNPHGVTAAQVGLGSVANTGDSATPVSGGTTKFTTGGAYTELNKKVDKVTGKGLSTNDYTTAEKNKLAGIDTGANAYTHPSYTAKSSGLYKITVDNSGHVSGATAVAKSDITALGIPAQDTTYTLDSFGISATATELNYVGGVTANVQTQLDAKMEKAGGTMTGALVAQNNANYTTKQVRNIILVAEGESIPSGSNGDICLVYTP